MNEIKSEINCLGSLLLSEESLAVEICEDEIDFSKLCRTCLRETSDNDLANDSLCIINTNGKLVRIHEMFEIATGLEIGADDRLPHHLCSSCLKLVNSSYAFRTQGQRANEILLSILGKVKEEHVEDVLDEVFEEEENEEHDVMVPDLLDQEQEEEEEVIDDSQHVLHEVLEIEQFDMASEPDDRYEILNTEAPANSFSCPFCPRVFLLQRDIIQHYRAEHPKEKPFKCAECQTSFAHIQSLRRHGKTHLASSKEKMCPLCSRLFHRADDLKRHIRTHTDERPYPCPMCQKAFKQHTELKDHMLSHTDSKMYECTMCSKEWRSRNGWYLHMKAHQEGWDGHRRKTKKKSAVKSSALLVPEGKKVAVKAV